MVSHGALNSSSRAEHGAAREKGGPFYVTSLNCTFSMSAYSSSYAMFVLLYPLYYLYLTNRNTLVRNNHLASLFVQLSIHESISARSFVT